MNLQAALALLGRHEAGLSMDPKDAGNWAGGQLRGTKYGISAAAYPGEDIAALTLERAHGIYARDYWGPAGCDAVPDELKFDLFDMAVNSGVKAAVRTLQQAAGETADGVLGPLTLQAVHTANPWRLVARFNGFRLQYMTDARTWPDHGRGWARRVAANLTREQA